MSIEKLETYFNAKDKPMIRRCKNCKHWQGEKEYHNDYQYGYCKINPMFFAFTLEKNVYALTKEFYLCENHKFELEEHLASVSLKILLKDAIIKR